MSNLTVSAEARIETRQDVAVISTKDALTILCLKCAKLKYRYSYGLHMHRQEETETCQCANTVSSVNVKKLLHALETALATCESIEQAKR